MKYTNKIRDSIFEIVEDVREGVTVSHRIHTGKLDDGTTRKVFDLVLSEGDGDKFKAASTHFWLDRVDYYGLRSLLRTDSKFDPFWETPTKRDLSALDLLTPGKKQNAKRPVRVIEINEVYESTSACARALDMDVANLSRKLSSSDKPVKVVMKDGVTTYTLEREPLERDLKHRRVTKTHKRPIYVVELQEIFESTSACARALGVDRANLSTKLSNSDKPVTITLKDGVTTRTLERV